MLTWGQLKAEIYKEDDLSEEVFADATEIIGYINDGINSIAKDIHAMGGQKYFENRSTISIVAGQQQYSLPNDIYAYKVTGIYDLNKRYELKPVNDKRELLSLQDSGEFFKYKILNLPIVIDPLTFLPIGGGLTIELYPKPLYDTNLTVYYIRKISEVVNDNSLIEIPESKEFLKAYVISRALNKERLAQDTQEAPRVAQLREQLLASLASIFIDENNIIELDASFYDGHN